METTIRMLQRKTPYYERNRAHVCSFFIRGECNRGDACPYRHEMPPQQNLKDRYHGVNHPVALKLLGKAGEMGTLESPEDLSIKTLCIGGPNPPTQAPSSACAPTPDSVSGAPSGSSSQQSAVTGSSQ